MLDQRQRLSQETEVVYNTRPALELSADFASAWIHCTSGQCVYWSRDNRWLCSFASYRQKDSCHLIFYFSTDYYSKQWVLPFFGSRVFWGLLLWCPACQIPSHGVDWQTCTRHRRGQGHWACRLPGLSFTLLCWFGFKEA